MKVLFSVPLKEKQVETFKEKFPEVEFIVETRKEVIYGMLPDIDIWATYGFDVDKEQMQRAEKLKWIMVYSAGVDALPKKEIGDKNIMVTNARGIHRHSIAEQVFAYILFRERSFDKCLQQQRDKVFNRRVSPQSIYGKTMGIIGVGAIGQEIARKAKAFDMKVLGIRNRPKDTAFVDEVFSMDSFHEVLRESDFVVMLLPLTEKTKHIMDKRAFQAMKEKGYFINVARGEVVDTEALVWAIQNNIIAGAALDVFEEEPLPKEHLLWELENVIITPHTAGLFPQYNTRANEIFMHNLQVYIHNEGEMVNAIDVKRGY